MPNRRSISSRAARLGVLGLVQAPQKPKFGTLEPSGAPGVPNLEDPVLSALSEAAFQRMVVAGLRQRGWRVFIVPDMRKTLAGLPDLLCLHPLLPGRMLAWELKRERRYVVSEKQAEALAMLATIPGVDARIVKPSDWLTLKEIV